MYVNMSLSAACCKLKVFLRNLNSGSLSTPEALLSVPGLGRTRVARLLDLQKAAVLRGRPIGVGDLLGVPGISPNLLAKIAGDPTAVILMKFAMYYRDVTEASILCPGDTVSVDLGWHNTAYAHMDNNLHLKEWGRLSLGPASPYSPAKCYDQVRACLEELPSAEAYLLEAQSHRSFPAKGFLHISVQLRALEAMIFAVLKETRKAPVYSLLPHMPSQYFGIVTRNKSLMKKKAFVSMTRKLIGACDSNVEKTPMGNVVRVSSKMRDYFEEQRKNDDLSDCFVQALAFLEWSQIARDLL